MEETFTVAAQGGHQTDLVRTVLEEVHHFVDLGLVNTGEKGDSGLLRGVA